MSQGMNRRDFVRAGATAAAGLATARPLWAGPPFVKRSQTASPLVVSDLSGIAFKNGGPLNAVEKALDEMTRGGDVLDAILAGVNIVELDPEETGVGYGALPNELGVVQLDASCMHGPRKRAGGVAALEGVRTPSLVAKAVMDDTDHHLLVGQGAQLFARHMGFTIEDDLNSDRSRKAWLEWKRRVQPEYYPKPEDRARRGYQVGLEMVREGLIPERSYWGTVHVSALNAKGEICAVTSTSGLAFKIAGRVGDSPILGAGIYVDNDVGACGSTGRGEANLYNLTSYLVVEHMRRGMHPKDAGLEALKRIRANTVEKRLLNGRGLPNFNIRFFALNAKGEHAGVAMYASGETTYGVCTDRGSQPVPLEPLLEGAPTD
jgi:N4-(beta-N-acetylglucosaminyl)-L-asparaginase